MRKTLSSQHALILVELGRVADAHARAAEGVERRPRVAALARRRLRDATRAKLPTPALRRPWQLERLLARAQGAHRPDEHTTEHPQCFRLLARTAPATRVYKVLVHYE